MKRFTYTVAFAVLLTACGTSSAPTDAPTDAPTTEIDPNNAWMRSERCCSPEDAVMTALLNDSIEVVFADEPQPDWYPALKDMSVSFDGWAAVITSNPEFADAMCRDIASVTFDDDAEPIGVTDVIVFDLAGDVLTDCDVPEL